MKADKKDLKDDQLKDFVNKSFKDEGLSSNFTHKVMLNIENTELAKEEKPLMPWWSWLIVGGGFITALVLALIYTSAPKEPITDIGENMPSLIEQNLKTIGYFTAILAIILLSQLFQLRKKMF